MKLIYLLVIKGMYDSLKNVLLVGKMFNHICCFFDVIFHLHAEYLIGVRPLHADSDS